VKGFSVQSYEKSMETLIVSFHTTLWRGPTKVITSRIPEKYFRDLEMIQKEEKIDRALFAYKICLIPFLPTAYLS
jgi:hypothetical protein